MDCSGSECLEGAIPNAKDFHCRNERLMVSRVIERTTERSLLISSFNRNDSFSSIVGMGQEDLLPPSETDATPGLLMDILARSGEIFALSLVKDSLHRFLFLELNVFYRCVKLLSEQGTASTQRSSLVPSPFPSVNITTRRGSRDMPLILFCTAPPIFFFLGGGIIGSDVDAAK